jgi:hypothetical protein
MESAFVMTTDSTTAEEHLAKLGIHLPVAPTSFGAYVPADQTGNLLLRRLLVPLDGSAFAEHASPLALCIAHRAGAAHRSDGTSKLEERQAPTIQPGNRTLKSAWRVTWPTP